MRTDLSGRLALVTGASSGLGRHFAATLGKWFGVSDADLNIVFPNLKNFNANLGFI